jgi:Na+/proline symporter
MGLPSDVGVTDALTLAGATGRLRTFDFHFDITEQYTFWSGTIAAFFLFCSYFGTDQSQVQRYLTTSSVDEARSSLLMSAYWKIPLQALVLLVGVLMFAFYVFAKPPMLFDTRHDRLVRSGPHAAEYSALESRFQTAVDARAAAALDAAHARQARDAERLAAARETFRTHDTEVRTIHDDARELVRTASGQSDFNDVNYVFPTFITTRLPVGLVGLIIAAILAAAMSATAGELSSLSTVSVIDFYRRFVKPEGTDAHYLLVSKAVTLFWGLFASVVAVWAVQLGSLIQVVNRFGSFFYGSILGVFVLAVAVPFATSNGAFIGLFAGMGLVALTAAYTKVAFLWHNVIGAVTVIIVGALVSLVWRKRS